MVQRLPILSPDAETHLIQRGNVTPRTVVWSFSHMGPTDNKPSADLFPASAADVYAWWICALNQAISGEAVLVGQNVAFDLALAVVHHNIPIRLVLEALQSGFVRDTKIRERLIGIARGWTSEAGWGGKDPRTGGGFSDNLAGIVKARLGIDLSADKKGPEAWRMRYAELDGVPLSEWPAEAKDYALMDTVYPPLCYLDQCEERPTPVGPLIEPDGRVVNETPQTMAAFCLHLMSINGPRTDPKVAKSFRRFHQDVVDEGIEVGKKAGFLRKNPKNPTGWSVTQKKIKMLIADAWGGDVPMKYITPKGQEAYAGQPAVRIDEDNFKFVSYSQDAMDACPNKLIQAYAKGQNSRKMISTYADILDLGTRGPLTSSPNVLVNTGRTSWAKPNLQNPPREGGFREGIVARPGKLFAFCDYSSVELVTLAQLQLWEYGQSSLADVINRGVDPHLWLAAILMDIPYEEAKDRKAKGDRAVKAFRQAAKAANFGFPGGMGPARVVETYGVKTMLAIAKPEDQVPNDIEQTAINAARRVKKIWLDTYPENRWTFAKVSNQTRNGRRFTFKQRPYGDEEGCTEKVGRIRGSVGYCDGLNTRFQGLAADVIKDALWHITWACYVDETSPLYGCRPWVLVHDEIGIEGPAETAHIWAYEFSRIMVASLARFCPDVKGAADPALARRWYKSADERFDKDGKLVPWEPWHRAFHEIRNDAGDVVDVELLDYWVLNHPHGLTARVDGRDRPSYEEMLAAEEAIGIT